MEANELGFEIKSLRESEMELIDSWSLNEFEVMQRSGRFEQAKSRMDLEKSKNQSIKQQLNEWQDLVPQPSRRMIFVALGSSLAPLDTSMNFELFTQAGDWVIRVVGRMNRKNDLWPMTDDAAEIAFLILSNRFILLSL
jgi:hypothetical protein